MLDVTKQFLNAIQALQGNTPALFALVTVSAFAVVGLALFALILAIRKVK
jgi:hypothetical protein